MSQNKAVRGFETVCLVLFGAVVGVFLSGYLPEIWAPQWLHWFDGIPDHIAYWGGLGSLLVLASSEAYIHREHGPATGAGVTVLNILGALGVVASIGSDLSQLIVLGLTAFIACRTASLVLNKNWKL